MTYGAYIKGIFLDIPKAARRVAILGGGALRAFYDKTVVKDYDLFFRSFEEYLEAVADFRLDDRYEALPAPAGTSQFRDEVSGRLFNLIGFHFDTPQGHRESFDFRCCMFCAWFQGGIPVATEHPEAEADARARRIVLMNNNGEERTLLRIKRYAEYGYALRSGDEPDGFQPTLEYITRVLSVFPRSTRGY